MDENEGVKARGDALRVPDDFKRQLIAQKIQMFLNTIYDAELDGKVAQMLGDERKQEGAEKRMKDALKAIDLLEKILSEIPEGPGQ